MQKQPMIKVQFISKQDLPEFVSLWNQDHKLLTSSKFRITLKKALEGFDAKMFIYYGLYLDNRLRGFALLIEDPKSLWLKHILIDKKFRNKKLGSLLLKKIHQISKKSNKPIKVEVVKNNMKTLSFFLKKQYKLVKFDLSENQHVLEKK